METKIKVCPRCTSDTIVVRKRGIAADAHLMVSGVGFGMRGTEEWKTHLCTTCGYFENCLTKRDWLDKIQSNPAKSGWRKLE